MAYMPTTPFYPPQNTNKPIPSAGSGPSVPSWELPPPQQPGSDTPATAGGFDRDSWLQRWRDQRRAIRQPINSGANQLPTPTIRNARGQVPGGPYREVMRPNVIGGAYPAPFGREAPMAFQSSAGYGMQIPSGMNQGMQLQPQGVVQGGVEMQPPTEPFEPEMPAWMRARLRRNPGGGGELGRGRGPRSGGKPPMQPMPVGIPQSPPAPPQQPWLNQVPNGYTSGRPPGFMAEQDPRFGGFDFMF